jgi:hypothetical protein
MKTYIRPFALLIVIACILFLTGCNSDTELSPVEKNTKILISHSWKISSLKIDNVDETGLYPGMTITFTASGFSSTNGEPVWPSSGTWLFSDTDGLMISRSDGIALTIQSISESQLVIALPWSKTTFKGGRLESINGNHVFTMVAL